MVFNNENNIKKLALLIITIIICVLIVLYKHYALPNIKAHFESRKSIAAEKIIQTSENDTTEGIKQETSFDEPKIKGIDFSDYTKYAHHEEDTFNSYENINITKEEQRQQKLAEKQAKKQEKQELKAQKQQAKKNKKAEKQRLKEERKLQKAEKKNKKNTDSDNLSKEDDINNNE